MSAVASVLVGYSYGGRRAANTFIVQTDDASPIDLEEAATQISAGWIASVMTQICDSVTFDLVRVRDLDASGLVESNPNVNGAVDVAGATPNVAYLVKHTLAGTTRRGRWFLPGVVEAAVDEYGVLTQEYVDGITEACQDFQTFIGAATQGLMLMKPANSGYAEVTSMTCDSKVSTQRRRLR